LEGARVLDLFAGAGTLGLEASSRGAESVVLVESAPRVCAVLERNIATVGGSARVVRQPVERVLESAATPFDLVLLDPPYAAGAIEGTLRALLRGGWLAADALVCVEHPAPVPLETPPGLEVVFSRGYGTAAVTILEMADEDRALPR